MATGSVNSVVLPGSATDEELLDRFVVQRDGTAEAAFRTLVVRHGPMVLGVCRHILNQHQDAEDAFQATFLVLARKASTIRDRKVLGRWLYEVAYRIAVRARTNAVRRQSHERQGAEMTAIAPDWDPAWTELRPVLHDEINRLPQKYRTPVVLCYLEGKTNEEVAQLLEWPVGTVKGRLSRARELLRSRLSRRGLALSVAFLAFALSADRAMAEVVPPRLVDETVDTAMRITSAPTAIPPRVSVLMDRVSNAWSVGRFALIVALGLVISGSLASAVAMAGKTADGKFDFRSILPWPVDSASVLHPTCHDLPPPMMPVPPKCAASQTHYQPQPQPAPPVPAEPVDDGIDLP
jgi:RNA polymerase sigma factor (sigma-70 family)